MRVQDCRFLGTRGPAAVQWGLEVLEIRNKEARILATDVDGIDGWPISMRQFLAIPGGSETGWRVITDVAKSLSPECIG
jgi:hypothetical protein